MIIADLQQVGQILRGSLPDAAADGVSPPPRLPPDRLLGCVRALGGWVAPEGLAPRAALDRLVEQGRLEAWPGRPLYRARVEAGATEPAK